MKILRITPRDVRTLIKKRQRKYYEQLAESGQGSELTIQ